MVYFLNAPLQLLVPVGISGGSVPFETGGLPILDQFTNYEIPISIPFVINEVWRIYFLDLE